MGATDSVAGTQNRMATDIIPFVPHFLLQHGHLQTIAGTFMRRTFFLAAPEDRLFRVDPESQIKGSCNWQPGKRKDVPVIVLVHGLEGSSDSNYVRGIADKAFARGYHAIRLNQRNCGGTERLTPTLYNSGMSSDYRAVLLELIAEGFQHIFFAGYSMGGNLVTKMAGEWGDAAPKNCAALPRFVLRWTCPRVPTRWKNLKTSSTSDIL